MRAFRKWSEAEPGAVHDFYIRLSRNAFMQKGPTRNPPRQRQLQSDLQLRLPSESARNISARRMENRAQHFPKKEQTVNIQLGVCCPAGLSVQGRRCPASSRIDCNAATWGLLSCSLFWIMLSCFCVFVWKCQRKRGGEVFCNFHVLRRGRPMQIVPKWPREFRPRPPPKSVLIFSQLSLSDLQPLVSFGSAQTFLCVQAIVQQM
jgi:hypothetical protein